MTWNVTLRTVAIDDIVAARGWYESRRSGLGDVFLLAIAEGLSELEDNPEEDAVYYRDFRRRLLTRFPYKFFYRIEGSDVIVFRVLHGARDHERELG